MMTHSRFGQTNRQTDRSCDRTVRAMHTHCAIKKTHCKQSTCDVWTAISWSVSFPSYIFRSANFSTPFKNEVVSSVEVTRGDPTVQADYETTTTSCTPV